MKFKEKLKNIVKQVKLDGAGSVFARDSLGYMSEFKFDRVSYIKEKLKELEEVGMVDNSAHRLRRRITYTFWIFFIEMLNQNVIFFNRIKKEGEQAWTEYMAEYPLAKDMGEIYWAENVEAFYIMVDIMKKFNTIIEQETLNFYHQFAKDLRSINDYLDKDFKKSGKRVGYKIGDIYLQDFSSYDEFSKAVVDKFEKKKKRYVIIWRMGGLYFCQGTAP